MLTRQFRRAVLAGGAAAACLTAVGVAAATTSADAAPAGSNGLVATYKVVGKTLVGKQNLLIHLAKSQLTADIHGSKTFIMFKADLPLPPTTVSFNLDGTVPVTATVVFTQVHRVTGSLPPVDGNLTVRSEAHYYVSLKDVSISGVPAEVGDSCQTIDPVVVYASTPKGHMFDLTKGGTITSRYRIGDFANCGPSTTLINQSIPSGNNFISLTLSNGKITAAS